MAANTLAVVGPLGFWEIAIILVIVLLIFGPKGLPKLARSLGQAMREFRDAASRMGETIGREAEEDERRDRERKKLSGSGQDRPPEQPEEESAEHGREPRTKQKEEKSPPKDDPESVARTPDQPR